ncbi:heterokaryon incompatibility protein-domain-containing protein [Lasiosphaeria ovina]|uniref:Heterokaryon incompatibility protein-domain-containing protein n=1 Tax=Lasiosphaeria ovina TaxID=92902 RepID=A0AAE0K6K7_9PEZI|nr:heterokaryon incompatibility protein-domain-containing protein [Lasiosphaeria ovina]
MSVCDLCQSAALWGSISHEGRASSASTFCRPSRLGKTQTVNHHSNITALIASSNACRVCKILSSAKALQNDQQWAVKLVETRAARSLVTVLELELWENAEVEDPGYSPFHGDDDPRIGICGSTNILATRAVWSKTSPVFAERVQVINDWLEHCFREHPTCGTAQTTYPARFLDLGTHGDESTISLACSAKIGALISPIRYVALSHCWGSSARPPLKTTKANLASHMQVIPTTALSRTFTDAIQVTRALGIRYLWIDSLCIIQDDDADWAAEAVKMASVYQGSYFTIAATSSSSGDGGLSLDGSDPDALIHVKFDGSPQQEGVEACSIRYPVASPRAIWDAPLSERAWVLQEQVLSARLVHFTEHQMYYQCRVGMESEDGTVRYPDSSSLRAHPSRGSETRDMSTPARAVGTWWSWVTEYSSRLLTFPSDRMAAIAGLVKYYQDAAGGTPVLGCWEETLWYDLGWNVELDGRSQNLAGCRAPTNIPTWSWLSIRPSTCVVSATNVSNLEDYHQKLSLASWHVEWEGVPFTSKLVSSQLVVLGLLKPLGMPLPPPRGKNPLRLDFECRWDEFLSVTILLDQLVDERERESSFLLHLFSNTSCHFCMVVTKEGTDMDPRYRRLGSGTIYHPKGHVGFFYDAICERVTLI